MDVSQGYRFLWIVGAAFVLLPQLNVGLLSDLKICGDSECESMMSRVQAIRDHHGKDCRFLNFRRGDTIFVYHKLTGRREDLWAGTIDKQFGYFPKDAVKEEQVYATTEKVVETQKSDFFCVDESGFLIDSTHLDTDDDSDLKIQIQESETTQITPNTHDTTADGSVEASTGYSIAAQEAEGDENKNAGNAAGLNEEAHATPATVNEQGGSPSSSPSWLSSSAIGWLGLSKEEQPDNLAEGEGGDERKETKAEESLTSSVTGWLGFGGKGEPDDAKESVNVEETSDSFASTLTGLFSFGGEKKNDAEKNEQDKERETDEEKEPTETFRSRRMSLDLEGSQLHEEEKKETGTFGWLTNGLSDRLGFGSTNQDPGHEASGGEGEEEKEQSVYSSWVDMGIGGYFGYGKDNAEVDEGKRNEKEKDVTLEQLAESVIVDSSQSQATATEEVKTETSNESQVEKPAKGQNVSSPETVSGDGNDDNDDDSKGAARRESSVSAVEAGLKVDHKDISANTKLEEQSQPEGRMPSMINSFFQTGDARDENLEDEVKIEDENHLMPNSMGNAREPGEEEMNTTSDSQDFITPEPDHSFDEQWLNSSGQPVGKDEKDETDRNGDSVEEEAIKITSEVDNSAETTDVLVKDEKEDQKGEETDLPHEEVFRNQTEDSAEENQVSGETEEISGQSQLFLSSSEKKNELIPAEDSFTPPITEANYKNSDTVTIADDDAETGTPRGELWQEEETQSVDESSQESVSESAESQYGNASEEDRGTISGEATLNINQASLSPGTEYSEQDTRDADEQKEAVKDQHEQTEETSGFEEDFSSDSDLKHTEAEDGKVKDFMKGGKKEAMEVRENEIVEDLKEEKLIEVVEVKEETQGEEQQKEKEEVKEEEKQENNQELEVEEGKKVEDSKEGGIEEFKWEKKGEEVMGLKGEEEANKAKEEQQQEVDELKFEEKQVEEIIEQEMQVRVDGSKELEEISEHEKINEGRQMQEVPVEIIQSDFSRPALESNKKGTPDDISSVSSLTETVTHTEIPQVEEEKGEEKGDEQKELQEVNDGKMEGEEVVENQQRSHVAYDSLKCLNEHCSQDRDEGAVIEGDGGASEDGGEGATWTGGQNNPAEQTGERQAIDSDEETLNNVVKGNDDSEVQTRKTHGETIGSGSHSGGGELPLSPDDPNESEAVTSEQSTSHSPEHLTGSTRLPGASQSESGGAFGVLKNAFGFFSQTPTIESQGSTQSTQNFNINSGETSQPQTSLTPEQELDSTTDSNHPQEAYTASPTEQPDTPAAGTFLHTAPSIPEAAHQTKALLKQYKNLLVQINVDEAAILMELLGRHKLQFLDYVLVSSEAMTVNREEDQSILSDIERLLDHHRETLVAPSMRLTDAPQEDKKRITMLSALQKLEMLLKTVKKTFNTGMSDVSYHQAEPRCASTSCSTQDSSIDQDSNIHRDEQMTVENNQMDGGKFKERNSVDEERRDKGSEEEEASGPHTQPESSQPPEGVIKQSLDFVLRVVEDVSIYTHAVRGFLIWLTVQVVSSLPDDIRPGPDLYGVPWEPVIYTSLVLLVTILLFTCRCYSSIKSRMYRSKERWMAEQVAELLDEKCKVLETLSQCQQEYDDLEDSLRDSGVLAQTQKAEHLEVKARQLEHAKSELERDLEQLKDQLDQQREHRQEQERRFAVLEESMKAFEEETKNLQSQDEQAQTTLKIYDMNSDRLQRNLDTAGEENSVLQESNTQLRQEVEGWAERVSELEAEMRRYEVAHSGMLQDVTNKDERIMSLTDQLLRMKAWDSELEEQEVGEGGEKDATNRSPEKGEENGRGDLTGKHLQKVQKLIFAAKLNADLKSVDEDKDRVFAKLNDEVKAKEDLQLSIKELENEQLTLQADSLHYSDQVQRLQQKLQIMTEMYQENELKLHRMLTVEEKERLQKEEKLNKADKNIAMAMEELNNYRQRAEEMEEELEKTRQSYQTQISAHEKKAHNNWLASRGAERDLADIRRENALLRQKLTDTQFKLDSLDKDPYALDSLARPLPFRAERSMYGPSPLGRPSSETRPFLSPPTLMDGPPARLSPRVSLGPGEPPGGQGEMERSGGPHSDNGSISPTWERDRRGPPPGPPGPVVPPGYMFPEPGGPMFRRPPPHPGALGLLPPPGSLPPGPPHPRGLPPGPDMADGSFRDNSLGPGDQGVRASGPGDHRAPPESDPRMGGPPPPGPPMGPMDGPFPRRAPYGPPPDFYAPRGPGGPPMMPRMMYPPRFAPGGPPLPPPPHPNMPSYNPAMGPPPPQQSLPSPPHSLSLQENTPSPEDAI
ncbi:cTAGE family member 5 [Leuresthes tenuis]|uniref:cTAGE family member 5 n=1 Tax=Leuresthes tenuis TaxID=355514 RepID=UPI003B50052F